MTIAISTLSTVANAVYTSTGNTAITSLTLCNYSASNVTANLYVVPNGNSAGTTTVALANVLLAVHDTLQMYVAAEKLLLGPGDAIYCNASANTSVTAVTSYTSI